MKTTHHRRSLLSVALVCSLAPILFIGCRTRSAAPARGTPADDLIAIDVLLQPDQAMIGKARAANARLRQNLPAGYELDASHVPHVTLVQRYVRARDLDAVTAAVSRALVGERPTEWLLRATGYDYVLWGGHALTVLDIERTPELTRLQQKVIDAVAPFSVSGGTGTAFAGTDSINRETMAGVEGYVPNSTGENYRPHVTFGVADEDFVRRMKSEPFETFTFRAVGVATYQLGNFGVAAKLLWQALPVGP